MNAIETTLYTSDTNEQGGLDLSGNKAFSSVFKLGLIMGSKDPESRQYPTNEEGLKKTKSRLEGMVFDCLTGLAGIGAIIGAANPRDLSEDDLGNIGSVIKNLSLLGIEAQDHIEGIEIDLRRRKERQDALDAMAQPIKKPRGVAIFAKAFLGIPAQQAAKITRPLMPSAAPAVLLHSLHTQQGVCNIVTQ